MGDPNEYKSTVPFTDGAAITKSDATVFSPPYRSLYIGVSGDVAIVTIKGTSLILENHPVGYLVGQVKQVLSTGTTASAMVGLI